MPVPSQAWRSYDLAELDRQYDARASVPSFDAEYAKYVVASTPLLADPRRQRDLVYDPRSDQKLDLYGAGAGTPLFLWIHGGYWRALSKEDNAFAAAGLLERGVSVAVLDYSLAPGVMLDEIVRQVRAAIVWLHAHAGELGINARKIHVGGSSAGGHLAGMLLAQDWQATHSLPPDVIGVALALSGLFDIEPLVHTKVNSWMAMDAAAARRNSPIRIVPARSAAHLIASVGGQETAEFKRQTEEYTAAFAKAGRTEVVPMPDYNHFDIALSLREPDGLLCQKLVSAIHAP